MYRQTNDYNSFQVRNTTEMGYLSHDKYPAQNEEYLGKHICLKYRSQKNQEFFSRFRVPECKEYEDYLYPENSGFLTFFEILRYDIEEPFRAILINNRMEVIVTYTAELEKLLDLVPSIMYTECVNRAEKRGFEYIAMNPTEDKEEFFEAYSNETIHVVPLPDVDLLGVEVYTEYDTDLSLDKSEAMDIPRNKYEFTEEMKDLMLKRNNRLFGMPTSIYQSYPHYYNIHSKSYIDDPIRVINKGYIIRADYIGSVEPELVVMEVLNDGSKRFVTQHEARFYFNMDNMVTQNVYELVHKDFTPNPDEQQEEEPIIDENTDIPDYDNNNGEDIIDENFDF